MSMHKQPLTKLEQEGLEKHGLPVDSPSQLSDAFRQGIAWLQSQVEPVAWMYSRPFEGQIDPIIYLKRVKETDRGSWAETPLCAYADPDEVERLREGITKHWKVVCDQRATIEGLRTQLAEAHALLRSLANNVVKMQNQLEDEFDSLGIEDNQMPGSTEIWNKVSKQAADVLSASAERNQCDGCQAGIPLVNGAHRMGKPGGYSDTMSCQAAKYARADLSAPVSFQSRVQPWLMECFGEMIAGDREERNHRFLEESLELVQALGATADDAHQLVDYVFGRPVGEPYQEVGGVMVTLAALCLANDLDMHQNAETELARIWTKVEAIRAKQAKKPQFGPLPGVYPDRELNHHPECNSNRPGTPGCDCPIGWKNKP